MLLCFNPTLVVEGKVTCAATELDRFVDSIQTIADELKEMGLYVRFDPGPFTRLDDPTDPSVSTTSAQLDLTDIEKIERLLEGITTYPSAIRSRGGRVVSHLELFNAAEEAPRAAIHAYYNPGGKMRTQTEAATLLGIDARELRNRLDLAFAQVREALEANRQAYISSLDLTTVEHASVAVLDLPLQGRMSLRGEGMVFIIDLTSLTLHEFRDRMGADDWTLPTTEALKAFGLSFADVPAYSTDRPAPDDALLEVLELTARTYSVLKRGEFRTIGDLTALTREQLRAWRNIHDREVDEVVEQLRRVGRKLAESADA